jgi:hypothetical protein
MRGVQSCNTALEPGGILHTGEVGAASAVVLHVSRCPQRGESFEVSLSVPSRDPNHGCEKRGRQRLRCIGPCYRQSRAGRTHRNASVTGLTMILSSRAMPGPGPRFSLVRIGKRRSRGSVKLAVPIMHPQTLELAPIASGAGAGGEGAAAVLPPRPPLSPPLTRIAWNATKAAFCWKAPPTSCSANLGTTGLAGSQGQGKGAQRPPCQCRPPASWQPVATKAQVASPVALR